MSLVQPKVVSFGMKAKPVYGEEIEGRSNVPYVIDTVVLSKLSRAMVASYYIIEIGKIEVG